MRIPIMIIALAIIILFTSCKKFDPYEPLSNVQVENLLQKAKAKHMELEKPCKTMTHSEITELIRKVIATPLESVNKKEVALLETNFGIVVIAFFPDKAPKHCEAFKKLVKTGFYDCTKFHRIVKNFMIQGGDILTRDDDPSNDGTGSPGYTLPAEFNDLPHGAGILSMARSQDINSAGSQFFICLSREGTKHLDGKYTAFGKVIGGMDVINEIANIKTIVPQPGMEPSAPVKDVYIKKAYMIKR